MGGILKITIMAKSSSKADHFYFVTFTYENSLLKVFCDCPAGSYGKFCKHKWQLLAGNIEMLFDIDEKDKLDIVNKWSKERAYFDLYKKVNELEAESMRLKKQISNEKKKIERKFREGF
jgi:uncharacterized Zn finger protein